MAAGLPLLLDDGTRKYVWGLGLAYAVSGGGATVEVFHTDGLGSVRALTDRSGAVVQTYEYDEFGVPVSSYGGHGQPLGYTGEPRDATGLINLRARLYDPKAGRFLSRDTYAGDASLPLSQNRYSYALNSPTNLTDPTHRFEIVTHRDD